jgi:tetratricopeptide (TPR) repeat protein
LPIHDHPDRDNGGAPAGLVRDDRPEARHLDVAATAAAVADLLTATAAEAGLMIIVDDLHDATADTIDVLSRTLSNLSGPILVLLFGRPELVRVAGALTRLADAEVLALAPLRGADAARLLGAYLGGGRLPQVDEDRLLATAQGNPFYLAELVAMLLERGALTRTDGSAQAPPASATGWRLAAGSLGGRLLSRDLAAVLAARIDALPVEARLALRDAAVVGDSVPAAALDTLHQRRTAPAGTTPGGLTPVRPGQASTEVDPAVDELLGRRMLRRAPAGYAFATPLLREAAYAGIGKADLAERHAHLAAWAAADGHRSDGGTVMASPERDVFIAEHAERAANLANAVGLRDDALARAAVPVGVAALGRAARRAVGLGEPQVAIGYAQRARALGGGDLPIADQLVLAKALLELGRVTEALGYAERISASDDLTSRAGALLVAGRAYRLLGDRDRGYHAWEDALIAAQATGSPAGQAEAMRRLGMADFLGGRLAEAGFRFTEAYQVAVAAGDRKSQAWSLQNLAWVTTTRGDFAGADAALARATRIFAELADPVGRAWLRGTTAFARLLAGRLAEARRLAQLFLPFGERVGEQWAVGTLGAVQAYAAAELGDLMQADRLARRAYRDFAIASDDWGRGFALLARGAIARGLGEFAHAQDLLTDALGYGVSTGHPLLVGVGHTQRGFAALDQGDTAAAKADARAALAGELLPDRIEPAQVGPQALLAAALLHEGDASASVGLLEPVAADPAGPCLLFARRYALATYAAALRETGELDRAVVIAQLATQLRGEDVRSAAVALREYATCRHAIGDRDGAAQTIALALATTHAGNQPVELARTEQLAATLR